jgi:asparagine synthase (glutamine-hydrolysing)
MCGFAGFIDFSRHLSASQMEEAIGRMTASLTHRGPDGGGLWVNSQGGVALGHRRLSILDLSPAGSQPMVSSNGQYTIVYNGEIFNHQDLRKSLEEKGHRFVGHSDTEVMLASFQEWGIEKSCIQFIGMFAFAVWDKEAQKVILGRDHVGIKPLYWGRNGQGIFFGSEGRSIRAHPSWVSTLDPTAIQAYVQYGYVPAPLAIEEGMEKLMPGTLRSFSVDGSVGDAIPFWNAHQVAQEGIGAREERAHGGLGQSEEDIIHQLEDLLRDGIHRQMEADVPLGAFLSGGIDSSLVAGIMQSQSSQPIQTFSIGFTDPDFDEAPYARRVADHLGTAHTEAYLTPEKVMELIPQIPLWYDEPFADSSQLPSFLVSQLARRQVTVALSGDGGDELFGGYYRYKAATHLWGILDKIPLALRQRVKGWASGTAADWLDKGVAALPPSLSVPQASHKVKKLVSILDAPTDQELYKRLVTFWGPEILASETSEKREDLLPRMWEKKWGDFPTLLDRMQFSDMISYLPDDILTKVDRVSMAVSLEGRVPLLDPRIIQFAWSLPQSFKRRNGQSKWILRQILKKYVPAHMVDRPKMGFGIPLGKWLAGPLRGWAEELLSPVSLAQSGFFNPVKVRQSWEEHVTGKGQWSSHLWILLLFQQWYAAQKDEQRDLNKKYESRKKGPHEDRRETDGILLHLF